MGALLVVAAACAQSAPAEPPAAAPDAGGSTVVPIDAATGPLVAVVGDSTAERLAPAVQAWGSGSSEIVFAGNGARLGCPIGRGGTMRTAADVTGPVNADCDWEATTTTGVDGTERPTFATVAGEWDPDLVVVFNGIWDVADRQLPGATEWSHAGEAAYDEWLLDELLAATDELSAGGATVVWLTLSPWEGATRHPPDRLYAPAADPARVVAYNALLARVAEARPDSAVVVDLAGWLAETGEDARLRPDGAHFDPATAAEVVDRYLGDALLAEWQRVS